MKRGLNNASLKEEGFSQDKEGCRGGLGVWGRKGADSSPDPEVGI